MRATLSDAGNQPDWAYGKVPLVVSRDFRLSRLAVAVYVEIGWASWKMAPYVELGGRLIAERLGVSKDGVYRAIKELVKCGHLTVVKTPKGKRQMYQLQNKCFEPLEKQGDRVARKVPEWVKKRMVAGR